MGRSMASEKYHLRCDTCGEEMTVVEFVPALEVDLMLGCEEPCPTNAEVSCMKPEHGSEQTHFGVYEKEYYW